VFCDGVLIPVGRLENGATIRREVVDAVTYWHIELAEHAIILAEGLPAESFLDTGNRGMFDNATASSVAARAKACAKLVERGPVLASVRAHLAARAAALGLSPAATLEIAVTAPGRLRRIVPPGVTRANIVSGSGHAAGDRRRLGALLAAVRLDDAALPAICFASGFHAPESHDGRAVRWTDGDAVLTLPPAPSPRVLDVEVCHLIGIAGLDPPSPDVHPHSLSGRWMPGPSPSMTVPEIVSFHGALLAAWYAAESA
jgi:hypothetical protein